MHACLPSCRSEKDPYRLPVSIERLQRMLRGKGSLSLQHAENLRTHTGMTSCAASCAAGWEKPWVEQIVDRIMKNMLRTTEERAVAVVRSI